MHIVVIGVDKMAEQKKQRNSWVELTNNFIFCFMKEKNKLVVWRYIPPTDNQESQVTMRKFNIGKETLEEVSLKAKGVMVI